MRTPPSSGSSNPAVAPGVDPAFAGCLALLAPGQAPGPGGQILHGPERALPGRGQQVVGGRRVLHGRPPDHRRLGPREPPGAKGLVHGRGLGHRLGRLQGGPGPTDRLARHPGQPPGGVAMPGRLEGRGGRHPAGIEGLSGSGQPLGLGEHLGQVGGLGAAHLVGRGTGQRRMQQGHRLAGPGPGLSGAGVHEEHDGMRVYQRRRQSTTGR